MKRTLTSGWYLFVVGTQLQSPRLNRCYNQQRRTERVKWLSKYIYTAGCTFIYNKITNICQHNKYLLEYV